MPLETIIAGVVIASLVLYALLGALLLFPSYYYLFRIFKLGHKEAQKAQ